MRSKLRINICDKVDLCHILHKPSWHINVMTPLLKSVTRHLHFSISFLSRICKRQASKSSLIFEPDKIRLLIFWKQWWNKHPWRYLWLCSLTPFSDYPNKKSSFRNTILEMKIGINIYLLENFPTLHDAHSHACFLLKDDKSIQMYKLFNKYVIFFSAECDRVAFCRACITHRVTQ
jgi:hypothetical protein